MELKKMIVRCMCAGIAGVMLSTATAFAAVNGTVTGDDINVRKSASLTAEVISKVNQGQVLSVVAVEGEFYKVVNGTASGYVAKQFVTVPAVLGTVNDASVNVRQTPNTSGVVVGVANKGECYEVTVKDGDWYGIVFNNKKAYVHKDFIVGADLAKVPVATPQPMLPDLAPQPAPDKPLMPDLPVAAKASEDLALRITVETANGPELPLIPDLDSPSVPQGLPVMALEDNAFVPVFVKETPVPLVAEAPEVLPVPPAEEVKEDAVETANTAEAEAVEDQETPTETPAQEAQKESIYAVITSDTGLNLRESASKDGEVVTVIPYGEVLDVFELGDAWIGVAYQGKTGYVSAEFVTVSRGEKPEKLVRETTKADEVLAYAAQFLGTPYVYGGTDLNKGVDCSGFVYSVMGHFGISLNRSSSAMASNGRAIDKSELQPGDLLFFSASGNGITHVAIYVGDGKYIHSTDGKGRGVSYANLYDSYSARTYHSARRVLE